jgi:hypothetical protein
LNPVLHCMKPVPRHWQVTLRIGFFYWHYSLSGPRPTSMKLSVSLRFFFLNRRQSVGLLGWVISSSQGLYLYTNTEKRTYTNTKHPCFEWDSNPRSRLPSERRQYIGYTWTNYLNRIILTSYSRIDMWGISQRFVKSGFEAHVSGWRWTEVFAEGWSTSL